MYTLLKHVFIFKSRDRLPKEQRHLLFALLERYYLALDTLAFPVPQGFTSFFAYLGYRVLSISKFMDYVRAHVLQVNIDVMKTIMSGKIGSNGISLMSV